jgi:two-component system nitrogen regulation response regulator GlnG
VKAKAFREDLYYRLNVVRIKMPALRERSSDIPQIVDFCLQNLVKQKKARVAKVAPEAMALLMRHQWPGNVRELENVIYRSAVIAQGDAILVKDLPAEIGGGSTVALAPVAEPGAPEAAPAAAKTAGAPAADAGTADLAKAFDVIFEQLKDEGGGMLARVETELAQRALAAHGGNEAAAARMLQISLPVLQRRLKRGGGK